MRCELAEVVIGLFASPLAEPPPLSDEEFGQPMTSSGLPFGSGRMSNVIDFRARSKACTARKAPAASVSRWSVLAGLRAIGLDRKEATRIEDCV